MKEIDMTDIVNDLPESMWGAFMSHQELWNDGEEAESIKPLAFMILKLCEQNQTLKNEIEDLKRAHEVAMNLIADNICNNKGG